MNVAFFEDVSFYYHDGTKVLSNVNFFLKEKEFLGVIGPNGGGKTTLLKLLLGLLTPTHGRIEVFGKSPKENRQVFSYVPQHPTFDKSFPISVGELALSGRLKHLPWFGKFNKEDKKISEEALEKVGILDLKERPIGSLSGGQLQRALIARALASQPTLLILDEPTASVDKEAERKIYHLLKNLSETITIVMVTHDLSTAIQLVDRVLCVEGQVSTFKTSEVCEHFALGLYHAPLLKKNVDESSCRLQVIKEESL
ncbi:metal ABC transporter ATP-binding protein [Criblamydia sequanensis]|uniref:ABC-type transporter, ATPase subunit n=1 Tax=Candidatus Criblamydia sequanensis CRIB-18 TaxID=1437425 RepID=A0A090D2E1_9BACT|nr:ABC transporter ATP-binding protein [Criblamydia sequanensis]CDR34590.1 ABC-type transporter, ATPase subunit [Criblamydia sequanensis CRIB-18]